MNHHLHKTIIAALLVLPLSFAFAEEEKGKGKGRPGQGGKGGQRGGFKPPVFSEIDTNQSGDVDKEEWLAHSIKAAKERAEKSFSHLAGEDGKISEAELNKMVERFGGQRGGSSKGGASKGGKGKGKGKGKGGDDSSGGGQKPKRPEVEE